MQRHLPAAPVGRERQQRPDGNRDRGLAVLAMDGEAEHAVDELPIMASRSDCLVHGGSFEDFPEKHARAKAWVSPVFCQKMQPLKKLVRASVFGRSRAQIKKSGRNRGPLALL